MCSTTVAIDRSSRRVFAYVRSSSLSSSTSAAGLPASSVSTVRAPLTVTSTVSRRIERAVVQVVEADADPVRTQGRVAGRRLLA